jgi:hypothetical protein
MGLDIEKIKVKKDTKDAQQKAHQLFKKATNAISFANRANKKVNEKIAAAAEEEVKGGPKDNDDAKSNLSNVSRPQTRPGGSRNQDNTSQLSKQSSKRSVLADDS